MTRISRRRRDAREHFWNGLGVLALIAAGMFAVTWMSLH